MTIPDIHEIIPLQKRDSFCYSFCYNLSIILLLIDQCQKKFTVSHRSVYCFPQPNPNIFIFSHIKQKQASEKQAPMIIWHVCLKNDLNIWSTVSWKQPISCWLTYHFTSKPHTVQRLRKLDRFMLSFDYLPSIYVISTLFPFQFDSEEFPWKNCSIYAQLKSYL